jgi:hypothetical protein
MSLEESSCSTHNEPEPHPGQRQAPDAAKVLGRDLCRCHGRIRAHLVAALLPSVGELRPPGPQDSTPSRLPAGQFADARIISADDWRSALAARRCNTGASCSTGTLRA